MQNFLYDIPTKVYFGKGQIEHLPGALKEYGSKVLLVYGGGSIKRIGLYDEVIKLLKENNIECFELSGVDPNPRVESVREGVRLCNENNVDVVLAVGGGSSIDCAKVIAASASYDGDAWDIVLDSSKAVSVLPVVSVLTLAATGSEMNWGAVISNMKTNDKLGVGHKGMIPKVSILDPTYTYSVPKNQTAAGTADIMSHIFEVYFQKERGNEVADRTAEGLLKLCIKNGPIAIENPEDYDARSNLMWAGSWAINGLLSLGKSGGWTVHPMEHELSAYYDITHGVGLAILTPHWMRSVLSEETVDKFVAYGVNVWNIDATLSDMEIANKAIDETAKFFASMNIPMTLKEVGIGEENLDIMAEKAAKHLAASFVALNKEEVRDIYKASL